MILTRLVPRCQMPFRGAEQLRSVFVKTNGEACFHALARAAQEFVQWDTAPLRIDVPERGFNADAGEVLPGQFVSRGYVLMEHGRHDDVAQLGPAGLRRIGRVERSGHRGRLAPAAEPVALYPNDDGILFGDRT